MTTSKRLRPLFIILCGITYGSTAGIANTNQKDASSTIMLWPKDAANQERTGMGTPRPDRGDGHIRLTDVTKPSIRYFPTPASKKSGPAVILCPGGGYTYLVTTKMESIAKWLKDHGVSAFILIYRTPKKRNEAFQDVQRAVRIVRSRASEWNIDPSRIGVMGSSAGGHLALWVAAAGHLPLDSPLGKRIKTQIQGAIGLAPIADLAAYSLGDNSCEVVTEKLMGGPAKALAERYALGSPSSLLPSADSILIHGEADTIVNISQSQRYAASSSRTSIISLKGLGHFDMINPEGPVFDRIIEALARLKLEASK